MKNTNALFLPDRSDAFDEAAMACAAIACIEAFTDAFNARDLAGMDCFLHFPHVILSGENLVIWDRAGQLPDDFFVELTRQTGWDHTVYQDKRVVLVSPRKVHLYVRYSRNRADGAVITFHENLWVVTWDEGRWGIKQRSY
ncbi:hypothetical protein [Pseudomonas sp. TH31]|uniref:hypothetical protein n=1 Tax=Pseudomonas sp. TH31 TaxID=2796396 RepID=UPI00191425DB|nr:hypothetical protein [Pseudomonas sp. TH31]MBK5415493.1 hypothetical protein [Pseudomonas sp. TH31]